MKKHLALILALTLTLTALLTGCGYEYKELNLRGTYDKSLEGTSLTVYNWGEYISDGADGSIDGSKISPALHYVLSHPVVIFSAITKKDGYVPKMLFVGVCVIGIFALYKYSEEPKRLHRRGTEHGSAKWGDEKEIRALAEKEKKPYQLALRDENGGYLYDDKGEFICADVDYNIVLAKDVYLALNTKQHRLNLNALVIGGSGSGKTLFWVITNILQLNTSFVITDPKGEIYQASRMLSFTRLRKRL